MLQLVRSQVWLLQVLAAGQGRAGSCRGGCEDAPSPAVSSWLVCVGQGYFQHDLQECALKGAVIFPKDVKFCLALVPASLLDLGMVLVSTIWEWCSLDTWRFGLWGMRCCKPI